MKINDFLECFNEALRQNRMERGYDNVGEFVFYQYYEKKLGNYYTYHMKIEYILNHNIVSNFVCLDQTIQLNNSLAGKNEAENILHKSIVTLFMTKLMQPEIYDSLIKGDYGA